VKTDVLVYLGVQGSQGRPFWKDYNIRSWGISTNQGLFYNNNSI